MKMEKRHFEFIAGVIRKAYGEPFHTTLLDKEELAEKFADALKETNSKFSKQVFIDAC